MLDWLKQINKESPDFWKAYLAKFGKKSNRYVVLSTENRMNLSSDVILSIGAFAIIDDSIHIKDSLRLFYCNINSFMTTICLTNLLLKVNYLNG
jgi:DNA polymerase-3 subunit epsilon